MLKYHHTQLFIL